jgi:hypothetical protein
MQQQQEEEEEGGEAVPPRFYDNGVERVPAQVGWELHWTIGCLKFSS